MRPTGEVRQTAAGNKLASVREMYEIDSELRLLAAVRRTAREMTGRATSTALIDGLLDERWKAAGTAESC